MVEQSAPGVAPYNTDNGKNGGDRQVFSKGRGEVEPWENQPLGYKGCDEAGSGV